MNKNLIIKLKNAKVQKEHKKLYSFAIWLLKNQDVSYGKIQRRINSTQKSMSGYFTLYVREHEKYQAKNRLRAKRTISNEKALEYQNKLQTNMRQILKLFNSGLLSNNSTKLIEQNINK